MVEEFIKVFPNKCMICAYWRFGITHCLTKESTPEHDCIEKNYGKR